MMTNLISFSNSKRPNILGFCTLILLLGSVLTLSACSKNKDLYKGMSEEQIYTQGVQNMSKTKYPQAIKDFEALEARYPYGLHSHEAQLALIEAYTKRSENEAAISAADRFIRMNPRHPNVDKAYYLKGLVNFDQNATFMYRHLPLDRSKRDPSAAQNSFDVFKELIERFPNSQYATEARQRMLFMREQLAHHEISVINYYMKRGAYLSAANRANYVLKNFPHTSAVPKALCSMVQAYRKLHMTQLEQETIHTLRTNFPNTEYVKNL